MKASVPSARSLGTPHRHRGIALVITLSFLLVTTVIIVAFLVRARFDYQASASYSTSVQSELLAAGAMDTVVANFLQEVADPAKSDVTTVGDFRWFEPKEAGSKFPSMVPDIVTRLPASPSGVRNTLIKQSIAQNFHTGSAAPSIPASDISSADDSRTNSRPVTPARWDLPRLLQNPDGERGADFTETDAPSWIYVKTNGDASTTAPPATSPFPIAGRYAYNVYDVGGLLNLNVTGYHSSTKRSDFETKGTPVFADLTQLPDMTSSQVDALLEWRAPQVPNWANTGDPTLPITSGPLSLLDYVRLGSAGGWRLNPSTTSPQGNQFLSRRDLIKYVADPANGFPNEGRDLLPFLTHFSIDANAPTFSPDTEILLLGNRSRRTGSVSNNVMENGNGNSITQADQTRINPPRSSEDTVIPNLPVGTSKTEEAPALFKRFPLSRLALVQTDPQVRGRAGSDSDLTQKFFGLIPVDDYTWQYNDGAGTDRIKTLEEVAALSPPREPNFFEILKSVIQVGSLAQARHRVDDDLLKTLEPRANRVDDHILKIGAAIIDQADEDSYPTRIRFNAVGGNSALGEIYGVENLPYLSAMRFVGYKKDSTRNEHWFLAQPTLWNPHNPDRRPSDTSKIPTQFRIAAIKPFQPRIQVSDARGGTTSAGQFNSGDVITFSWSPQSLAFRQPQGLLSTTYPPEIGASGGSLVPIHPVEKQLFNGFDPFPGNLALGFLMGQTTQGFSGSLPDAVRYSDGFAEFQLQYDAPGGPYTYDRIHFAPNGVQALPHGEHPAGLTFTSLLANRDSPTSGSGRAEAIYAKSDPRSQRFIWPSDIISFTSGNVTRRFALAEGTGFGWYGGIYSKTDGGGNNGPAGGETTLNYTDLWYLGNQANTGNDRGIRDDVGFISINSLKATSSSNRGIHYNDNDGVVRRAVAGAMDFVSWRRRFPNPPPVAQFRTENRQNDAFPMPLQGQGLRSLTETHSDYYQNRPIILNRPFRSVGELAYAFRDVPWKHIDLSFQESGDTGLLDVFTAYETESNGHSATPLVAGKVNLNTAPPPVLKALLNRTARELPTDSVPSPSQGTLTEADRDALTNRFVTYRSTEGSVDESEGGVNGPLRSLAEIVGRVYSDSAGDFSDHASFVGLHPEQAGTGIDKVRPERLSAAARSLADVGTTRTWNLMIDLVAQSGRIPPDGDLAEFAANSESRLWLFVSIDRFTGKVLAQSIERVIE